MKTSILTKVCLTAAGIVIFTGCVITDNFFQPVSSVSGKNLIKEIEKASQEGLILGIAVNPNSSAMLSGQPGIAGMPLFMSGISGNIIVRTLKIDEKKDYTRSSADVCVESVKNSYFAVMAAGIEPPPIAGGYLASLKCSLQETGKIIHFSDDISI